MAFESFGSQDASWAGRTYQEIRTIGERDGSVLIVPVGSTEQHGHHLPVATDTILADAVAYLGADRVSGDVPLAVTPPVWTGFSPHHMPLGGTLTLEFRTLLSVVEGIAGSGIENGFDALLLLNGHGGNGPLIDAAVSTVGERHPDVEVLGLTYFKLATPFIDDIRESDTGGMAHGGEFETSLMLHLRPDLVGDDEDPKAAYWEEPYERGGQDLHDSGVLGVYRTFDEYSASGAIGDPALADAEKGEAIYELLGDELAEVLRRIHERNA